MIDKEKLIQWNPDIIFIDEGGLELIRQDYQKNKPFYQVLGAVKKGQIYGQLPYNYYTTNIDTAIANAYHIGKVLYPDHFADIDPVAKANEIYEFLVGQGVMSRWPRITVDTWPSTWNRDLADPGRAR